MPIRSMNWRRLVAAASLTGMSPTPVKSTVVRNGRCPAGRPTTRTTSSATACTSGVSPGRVIPRLACSLRSR
jgi:hypothetical protein